MILIWLICIHDKNSDYINTSMSLKRSIRKKGSIEKKKLIITQARKCILRVRKFEWHWHSFSLVIFFLCPPPFIFFTTTWMTRLNAALAAINRLILSIHLILFSLPKSWSVYVNYILVMTLVGFWVNLCASSVLLVFDYKAAHEV